MAKYTKYSDKDGVWRTIGGRRVFIRTGASLSQAMKESGKFKTGDRREVQEAKAEERIDKLGKKNTELYRKHGGFADTGDKAENKKVDRAHKQWLDNAREANDKKAIYQWGEYDNPKEADKTYDLIGQHINKDQQLGSISNKAKNMLMNDYNMSEAEADRQINIMKDTKARWEEDSLNRMRHDVRNNVYVHDDGYAEDVPKGLKQLQHERRKEQSKIDRNEFANNMERTEIQKRIVEYDKAILEEKNRNSNDYEYNLYKRARQDENSIDPMTENSTDWEALDKKYRARYEDEEDKRNGKTLSDVYSYTDKQIDEGKNPLFNKKNSYWDNIKAGKVDTAGKSNRKEVSNNIQAHIKDYYDSAEDFVSQMEAMKDPSHPTAWSWGQELAKGGSYLIYNGDMEDFLNNLNINPKGKKFNDEQVFNNYTALIGRESAKMYDNIRKDAVNTLAERYSGTIDYLKETENMSTSEILELLKKMDK